MRIAHWPRSGAISAQSAAVRVRICGRRWVKLGALTAPGRKRGGERSRVWTLCVLGTWCWWWRRGGETTQTLLKSEFGSAFHRVVLSQLDYLRAGKNAETFVNFKTSVWMRPGWMRACFWTWLRYIRAGIWSSAAFTQNSDKLFLAAGFSPSCLFCLLLSDPTLVFGFF